jgi:hypothetical protein
MPKIRTYKVQSAGCGVPYIPIKGKFLSKEFNLQIGDHVEIIPANGAVFFRQLSNAEVSSKQSISLRTTFKRFFNDCERYVLDNDNQPVRFDDHKDFINQLKECGQIILNLQVLTLDETKKVGLLDIINTYKSQLATCEQSFYEMAEAVLIGIQFDSYHHLIDLLRKCGQRLGILHKGSKIVPVKKKKNNKPTQKRHSNVYYSSSGELMVAESKSNTYSVEDEYKRLSSRLNCEELSELARLVCEHNTTNT